MQGIARDKNAIGLFGYAYFVENQKRLNALSIVAAAGKPAVAPSEKTVENGTYQPLARPIFIYVNGKSLDRTEVREFVEFYLKHGGALAREVKYVALPPKAYELARAHLKNKKLGTVFGGTAEVGVTIDELLQRESKQ